MEAISSNAMVAATFGGVAAGLILGILAAGAGDGDPAAAAGAPCQPAGRIRGEGSYAHSITATSDGSRPSFEGQIGGGNFFRVSHPNVRDFADSVTVAPGDRVWVGARFDNPGPGEVGEVEYRVELPKHAARVLKLIATITFNGLGGITHLHDSAYVYVKPAISACARYVPGTMAEGRRYLDDSLWKQPILGEDHVISDEGLFLGGFPPMKRPEARYMYFEVVVI
jgi:hypothetical protein